MPNRMCIRFKNRCRYLPSLRTESLSIFLDKSGREKNTLPAGSTSFYLPLIQEMDESVRFKTSFYCFTAVRILHDRISPKMRRHLAMALKYWVLNNSYYLLRLGHVVFVIALSCGKNPLLQHKTPQRRIEGEKVNYSFKQEGGSVSFVFPYSLTTDSSLPV